MQMSPFTDKPIHHLPLLQKLGCHIQNFGTSLKTVTLFHFASNARDIGLQRSKSPLITITKMSFFVMLYYDTIWQLFLIYHSTVTSAVFTNKADHVVSGSDDRTVKVRTSAEFIWSPTQIHLLFSTSLESPSADTMLKIFYRTSHSLKLQNL